MAETVFNQYQHFVPQFLIKNFSHPFKPPTQGRKRSQGQRRKAVNGMYPNDPVVNNLCLSVDPPILCEALVKRVFGQRDMYRDTSKPSAEQQRIEKMFSNLEDRTSIIFRKITKSFQQKDKGVWLTRDERNLARKFLFLLKYRGSAFHQRFYHENVEGYDSNDRVLLRDYMTEKGYKRPMDVWLDNLNTIMKLHMDPEGEWMTDLPKRMFPIDAMWFITHVQSSYMAICTPSNPSDEFILTENSYNVFEGPNYFVTDEDTGKVEGAQHTPLHEFAPVSSKLMIILRSVVLPVPEEDVDPYAEEERKYLRSLVLDSVYKEDIKSVLAGLPITKARNSYSTIIDGRVQANSGDWKRSKDDKFCFEFFPITAEHVQIINGIFLDNGYTSSRVIFESKTSFAQTLETYLTASSAPEKFITGDDVDLRLAFLKKLAMISQSLGSNKKPTWRVEPPPTIKGFRDFSLGMNEKYRWFTKMITDDWKRGSDNGFMQIYQSLGGSKEGLFKDIEQSGLMWQLRVRIDSWSKGLDETLRERNRQLLIEAYLRLPPGRVLTEVASHVITSDRLAQLLYKATSNDITMKGKLGSNLWASVSNPNLNVIERMMALRLLSSTVPGYIRDCGIIEIEQLARSQQLEVLRSCRHDTEIFSYPMLEDGENIELLTRARVRSQFSNVLSGKLDEFLLKSLKDVFFEIIYPTPA